MHTAKLTANVTRPADTTAYAAGDVVSTAGGARLTFSGFPERTGTARGALIESALCIDSANQSTKPDLELYLFDTDITDLDADNATWTPTDAQLATAVGVIAFATANFKGGDLTSGAGGNAICWVNNAAITVTGDTLYGVLIARNAYTPVASEQFTIVLNVVR